MIILIFVAVLAKIFFAFYLWNPRASYGEYDQEVMYDDSLETVHPQNFYHNYFGHDLGHLERVRLRLRAKHHTPVWLAGDSSLDNKHWLFNNVYAKNLEESITVPARSIYADFLDPPLCLPDVTACLNEELADTNYTAINCAIEESSLYDRRPDKFPSHDRFIQDNITEDDILIVSVGGNDLVLKTCFRTLFWMFVTLFSPLPFLPGYISNLFRDQVQSYVERLTEKARPRAVIVCMFYYPCDVGAGWIDKTPWSRFYYRAKPRIDQIFEECTRKIKIAGTKVYPVHLGKVLDPACADDYVSRVEPSAQGGRKMAKIFSEIIKNL